MDGWHATAGTVSPRCSAAAMSSELPSNRSGIRWGTGKLGEFSREFQAAACSALPGVTTSASPPSQPVFTRRCGGAVVDTCAMRALFSRTSIRAVTSTSRGVVMVRRNTPGSSGGSTKDGSHTVAPVGPSAQGSAPE